MTLLYLAIAFVAGAALGSTAWIAGVVPCDFPAWPWIALSCALPFTPLLYRFRAEPDRDVELRWPRSAGFVAPRSSLSLGLMAAVVLCVATGFARYRRTLSIRALIQTISPTGTPHTTFHTAILTRQRS